HARAPREPAPRPRRPPRTPAPTDRAPRRRSLPSPGASPWASSRIPTARRTEKVTPNAKGPRRARALGGTCSARLSSRGRRELLPLVFVQILAAPALEDGHDRRHDRRDERDLHQLAEEPALLRFLSSFGHRRLLLAGWAWLDLNQRPHPYQGCALPELSYRPGGTLQCLHPARRQAYAWLRKGVNVRLTCACARRTGRATGARRACPRCRRRRRRAGCTGTR